MLICRRLLRTFPTGCCSALLAILAVGCADGGPDTVPSQRLVDLFDRDSTEVVGSPEIQKAPRAAWRFAGDPPGDSTTHGWTSKSGVDGLEVVDGRLSGRATGDAPVLHVEWVDGSDPDDRLRSVEIELLATAGANLEVEFKDEDDALDDLTSDDWDLTTPILPGEEVRSYSITSEGNTRASNIRHVLIRPTDEAGARFEIASVRLLFDREYLAETPSGIGWQGLAEIYRESLVAKAPESMRLPLTLPPRPWLDLSIGTLEEGAVTFEVDVRSADGTETRLLEQTVTTPNRWQSVPLDLSQFTGQSVTLSLTLNSPREGALGLWGAPAVRSHGALPPGRPALGLPPPQGVVVIMADTIRSDHLGAYGYERDTTPTLSRMASQGTTFRDVIAQATWTKVSTPSILTSMYPASHTVKTVPDRLPSAATTLAEVFRDAGYATLAFSSVMFTGQSTNLHQGVEVLHEAASRTGDKQSKSARQYVDRLLPWLETHREIPFFVFLHVFDPHSPFEPRPPYDALWADPALKERHLEHVAAVREHITTPFLKRVGMPSRTELQAAGVDEDEFVSYWHDWYDGSIRGMDTEIGRLFQQLDTLGLQDRTLVAFIGDHGEEFLEHGRTWHGHTVYGELTNVPMLLWQPGVVPADLEVTDTVRSLDLMPTLLTLSGLPVPVTAQGQTLTPLLGIPGADDQMSEWVVRAAVAEEHAQDLEGNDKHESFAVVLDGWRLVRNTLPEGEPEDEFELYNHANDPLGLHDVASEHPEVVERLTREHDRWKQRSEAARLQSDEELTSTLSADELRRLRSLGYVR